MATSMLKNRSTPKAAPKVSRFRADIQGLRALAVLAVIMDHMLHWPSGGFVGVDVFFVISGFMITSILLREHEETGRLSFKGFYVRRAKRLLPASVLTIGATAIAAWLIFAKTRAVETLWDALAALLISSNWRFAAAGTDYFQQGTPPSPLQHFWSLGVEEQFYFVWPFLLAAVFFAVGANASSKKRRWFAGWAMVVIIGASLAWSMAESSTSPTWAYFSTFSRVWEMGVGALLAVGAGAFLRIPRSLRPVLAWLGLAGIVASMFIIKPTDVFPAPWALMPVVATALIIAANIGGDQRGLNVLTNKVSVYLGNISFSLYLWHFPVIIFTTTLLPSGEGKTYLVIAILIALLATGSYHGVENPLRKMAWTFRVPKHGRKEANERLQIIGIVVLFIFTAAAVTFALTQSASMAGQYTVPPQQPSNTTAAAPKSPIASSLEVALSATEWPELSPRIDEVGTKAKAPELGIAGCLNSSNLDDAEQCTFNPSGAKSAVVVGDSIGLSWLPGVRGALEPEGYSVHAVGLSNCPFADVAIGIANDPETSTRCNDGHAKIYAQIKAANPDLIVISDSVAGIVNLASGSQGSGADTEWSAALASAINQSKGDRSRVFILSPNPTGKAVAECYNNFSKPSDCESPISPTWKQKSGADASAAKTAGATYVDTSQWFCSGERCPIFADGAPIRWDGMHLTEAYSKKMAPQLKPVLLSAGS